MAPPPRKPAAPKPAPRAEAFIGNDSATMMTEESFEEFEARMKAEAAEKADDERTRSEAAAEEPQDEDAGE